MDSGRDDNKPPQAAHPEHQRAPGDGQGRGQDRLDQVGTQAMRAAHDLTDEAKAHGAALAGDLKDSVASALGGAKDEAAAGLKDIADALHRSGKELGGQHDWIAQLIDQGASGLGEVAESLRTNDLAGMMSKVQDLARRQPAVFAGAAMALGFAAVRLGRIAATAPSTPSTSTTSSTPSTPASHGAAAKAGPHATEARDVTT